MFWATPVPLSPPLQRPPSFGRASQRCRNWKRCLLMTRDSSSARGVDWYASSSHCAPTVCCLDQLEQQVEERVEEQRGRGGRYRLQTLTTHCQRCHLAAILDETYNNNTLQQYNQLTESEKLRQ